MNRTNAMLLISVLVPLLVVATPTKPQTLEARQMTFGDPDPHVFFEHVFIQIKGMWHDVTLRVTSNIKSLIPDQIQTRDKTRTLKWEDLPVLPPSSPPTDPEDTFNWDYIKEHYPWQPAHDKNRPKHQLWSDVTDHAYCLHFRPGTRLPVPGKRSYSSPYLPQNCTDLLHTDLTLRTPVKLNTFSIFPCGGFQSGGYLPNETHKYMNTNPPLNADATSGAPENASATMYYANTHAYIMFTPDWRNPDHCRAGCETCLDAMAEFGAEGAVCRRKKNEQYCGVGVVSGELPSEPCLKEYNDGVYPTASVNCWLDSNAPRWREMGFRNLDEALDSGQVQLYYMSDLPYVGAHFGGDGGKWGKREVLKMALEEGYRVNDAVSETRKVLGNPRDDSGAPVAPPATL